MKINIYYGGRGLIADSTLYVLTRMTEVLEELRVEVSRYNLFECKKEIASLSGTLKDADGVVLAANVEWFGIGGYLQTFLDSCWLYADKSKLSKIYMMPVVISHTYGEREANETLKRSWELLGGMLCPGICAFVANQAEFETNPDYSKLIEKRTEDLYRTINQKPVRFPSSTAQILSRSMEPSSMKLTPQEGEILSKYVSDDAFVQRQRQDLDELQKLYSDIMDNGEAGQEFLKNFKDNFNPPTENIRAVLLIKMTDTEKSLVVDVSNERLKVYYGDCENPDVVVTGTRDVVGRIVNGRSTFQGAFMHGDLSYKGDFKVYRQFDNFFRFTKV